MPVAIHPARADEFDAADRVVTEAFGDARIAAMVRAIRASRLYRSELELVAVDDATVVGHVMISGTTLRHAAGERIVPMLSPLAVTPSRHREGIATALIAAALAETDARGEPLVVLEGSPDFYGRRGFSPARAAGISVPIPDWAPAEAAQVALLRAYDESDPTLRGEVIYPPAVAALEA